MNRTCRWTIALLLVAATWLAAPGQARVRRSGASSAAAARRPVSPPRIIDLNIDTVMRSVTVRFTRSDPRSRSKEGFECALSRPSGPIRYERCASPETYWGLGPGAHTFRVRARSTPRRRSKPALRAVDLPVEFSRCWGAASRDPLHPCHNPALDRLVDPAPAEAFTTTGYCDGLHSEGPENLVCSFGVEGPKASGTVALIGDSHAAVLRRAMEYVAEKRRWSGVNLGHNGCGFSAAYMRAVPSEISVACHEWVQEVTAWLAQRPRVHTVVITGSDAWRYASDAQAGFHTAWQALPASVKRIYIIRDVPIATTGESDCVDSAIALGRPAGPMCAQPRSAVLRPDAEAAAAKDSRSPRVGLIDLSSFFCGNRCLPVIGGVLVLADTEHLTGEFSGTLGPYILRAMT